MNKNVILILTIVMLSVVAQLSLITGVDWMQYARADISEGQWWRFFTGNLVHLTWRHLIMNLLALIAIVMLYPKCLRAVGLFSVLVMSCLSVTLGMWVLSPEIQWYAGLSGALHGLLATLIIIDYVSHKHWLNIIVFIALMVKLIWEGVLGPMPGSASAAGGPVVVQAHLYGFMGGLVIAAYINIFIKNKKLEK